MPPKPKYTREEIIAAALELVSKKGMSALTARDLGARLGTSARPIFTAFQSMDEVADGVKAAAMERFESYAHKAGSDMPIFKQVGMQMILFAKEEPRLYQLVFMSQNSDVKSFADIYEHLGRVADECLNIAGKADDGLGDDQVYFSAERIVDHVLETLASVGVAAGDAFI